MCIKIYFKNKPIKFIFIQKQIIIKTKYLFSASIGVINTFSLDKKIIKDSYKTVSDFFLKKPHVLLRTIIFSSLSPFSFLHSRSKSIVFFPIEEVSTFSARTGPLLGPSHEASHYIKTTREPTRQGSPKTRVGSRVPPAGHLTTYGKIRKVYIYP